MSFRNWLSNTLIPVGLGGIVGGFLAITAYTILDTDPVPLINNLQLPTLEKTTVANKYVIAHREECPTCAIGMNIPSGVYNAISNELAYRQYNGNGRDRRHSGHRVYWGRKGGEKVAVIYPLIRHEINGEIMLVQPEDIWQDQVHVVAVDDLMDPCPDACYCYKEISGDVFQCVFTQQ